jgi:hypothetical protein
MSILERGTGGAPILDYAGPASRRALRLPAQSVISVREEPGHLTIVERLAGHGGAVAALGLAAFTLLILIMVETSLAAKWHKTLDEMLLIGGLIAAEACVGALVINNTWRKTVLEVTPEMLNVTFSAPFTGRSRFEFRDEMIAAIAVIDTALAPGAPVVPELEIRMWNAPPVRLFIGHRQGELEDLAARMRRIQPPGETTRSDA